MIYFFNRDLEADLELEFKVTLVLYNVAEKQSTRRNFKEAFYRPSASCASFGQVIDTEASSEGRGRIPYGAVLTFTLGTYHTGDFSFIFLFVYTQLGMNSK